jgi:hypothetical protein
LAAVPAPISRWAWRLYEKGEDRFWEVVRSQAKLVYDVDDTRTSAHGVYYTPSSPLTVVARAKKIAGEYRVSPGNTKGDLANSSR